MGRSWPTRAIKIVVSTPAGGITDAFARAYGDYISQKLGQPVIVENKTGASGALAAQSVKDFPGGRLHADVHDLVHLAR